MNKAFAYIRETFGGGLTADHECGRLRRWFETNDGNFQGIQYAGVLQDHAATGKLSLFRRPQGQHLLTELERGDVLLLPNLSSAFGSKADGITSLHAFSMAGIRTFVIEPAMECECIDGKLSDDLAHAFGIAERELHAELTRQALARTSASGQWLGNTPPGWRIQPPKGKQQGVGSIVPDYPGREVAVRAARELASGRSTLAVANGISHRVASLQMNRRSHQRGKWFTPKSIVTMATYALLDFPPLTRKKVAAMIGCNPFRAAFVRDHYGKPSDEIIATASVAA